MGRLARALRPASMPRRVLQRVRALAERWRDANGTRLTPVPTATALKVSMLRYPCASSPHRLLVDTTSRLLVPWRVQLENLPAEPFGSRSEHRRKAMEGVRMKGVVFTEFLDMVAEEHGLETLDQMIEDANVPSAAAYTAVGTYDHREIIMLSTALGTITGTDAAGLIEAFGRHLFGRFAVLYPQFFDQQTTAFEFIQSVEGTIHVEVMKLYPDAELPRLATEVLSSGRLRVTYRSQRSLADLAEGLLCACIEHFDEDIELRRAPADDRSVVFELISAVPVEQK